MGLKEAIQHMIQSEAFRSKAKQKNSEGGKYRMFLTKHNRGELKNGAIFDFLLSHGYTVTVKKPK